MRDGPLRVAVKALARWVWTFEVALRRGGRRLRERPTWELAGACRACARCCEEPDIRVGVAMFHLPLLHRPWLWWQRVVNGFELSGTDRDALAFHFRCTHFDRATRRCDSYDSRPGVCRDYPRELLDQAWPELFEGCQFKVLAADRARQLAVLESQGLPPETLAALKQKLRLE